MNPTHGRESGSVTLWLVVTVVAMFAAVGVVSDGGLALAAKGSAISDAYGAARAGAEALDRVGFARGGAPSPDPVVAEAAADTFLARAGVASAQAQVVVNPPEVTVTVHLVSPTRILGAVGIGSFAVTGTGHARAVYGVGGPTP